MDYSIFLILFTQCLCNISTGEVKKDFHCLNNCRLSLLIMVTGLNSINCVCSLDFAKYHIDTSYCEENIYFTQAKLKLSQLQPQCNVKWHVSCYLICRSNHELKHGSRRSLLWQHQRVEYITSVSRLKTQWLMLGKHGKYRPYIKTTWEVYLLEQDERCFDAGDNDHVSAAELNFHGRMDELTN